jgi:hypothetical protein
MGTRIELTQKPVIKHQLVEVGKSVTLRIAGLNLENQVATEETIKSLKELRAVLNKEFAEFENQRKYLKNAVAAPYQEFELVYTTEISEKYKQAVDLLRDKIALFENNVKKEKQENIICYFNELCADSEIDFLKFEHTGLEINISTSEKQYKEKCAAFVARVADDIILIQGIEYPVETMAEYKSILNASKAITAVRERKEKEKLEAERIKTIETSKRLAFLKGLNFVYSDMTKSYNLMNDNSVFILFSDVENLSPNDFRKEYTRLEIAIKQINDEKAKAEIVKNTNTPISAPISAPVEIIPEKINEPAKIVKAIFEVTGTMPQLMALKEFLVSNNYNFKNI